MGMNRSFHAGADSHGEFDHFSVLLIDGTDLMGQGILAIPSPLHSQVAAMPSDHGAGS
jgi:hypothetical protein